MKICSQCGYCNGDYMDACARCRAPLNGAPIPNGASAPQAGSGYGAPAALPPGYTPRPSYPPQGQSCYAQTPTPAPRGLGAPASVPYGQTGMPQAQNRFGQAPQGLSPYAPPPAAQQVTRPQPGAYPLSPPQYSQNVRPQPPQPQRPPQPRPPEQPSEYTSLLGNENLNSLNDFSVQPAKRSSAGLVIIILLILLVLTGGVTWYFYTNELFPAEVRSSIDSVISSVTGFLGVNNDSPDQTGNEQFDIMVSRVRNTAGTDDEQAKTIVNTLIQKCGATGISSILPIGETALYQIKSPGGFFKIHIDPNTKVLTRVETDESIPRAIYADGTSFASVSDFCIPEEIMEKLKENARATLKGAVSNPELITFEENDGWDFHKDKDWIAVYCTAISEAEGTTENRIPFYFEYQLQGNTYTLLFARIGDKTDGTQHFTEGAQNSPYTDDSAQPDETAGQPTA